MNEEFVKRIYDTCVNDGVKLYRKQFETIKVNEKSSEFTKKSIELYDLLNKEQKNVFLDVLQTTIVDTVSLVFGLIDGSSTLNGGSMEISMTIEGCDTEQELQDAFLAYVEELND